MKGLYPLMHAALSWDGVCMVLAHIKLQSKCQPQIPSAAAWSMQPTRSNLYQSPSMAEKYELEPSLSARSLRHRWLMTINCAGHWSTDPRLVNLGKRIILSKADKPDAAMAHVKIATPQHFQRWRYVYGVAEGDEIPQGRRS